MTWCLTQVEFTFSKALLSLCSSLAFIQVFNEIMISQHRPCIKGGIKSVKTFLSHFKSVHKASSTSNFVLNLIVSLIVEFMLNYRSPLSICISIGSWQCPYVGSYIRSTRTFLIHLKKVCIVNLISKKVSLALKSYFTIPLGIDQQLAPSTLDVQNLSTTHEVFIN